MGLELHIYDFDGTLFRSPHAPAFWMGQWWSAAESLLPPCVPEHPGSDWWVASTVAAARQSIANPDVYAVLITGRPARSGLRYRVPELLKLAGLRFDEVFLSNTDSTVTFKQRTILSLLQRLPAIDKVVLWDDNAGYLRTYERLLRRMEIDVEANLVRAKAMPAECEAETPAVIPKASYLGAFLDSRSKAALLDAFPAAHDNEYADHITIALNPDAGLAAELNGKRFEAVVTGYAEDSKGQAAQVKLVAPIRLEDQMGKARPLHVTISTATGVKPVYSNELLARSGTMSNIDRLVLTGSIGTSR